MGWTCGHFKWGAIVVALGSSGLAAAAGARLNDTGQDRCVDPKTLEFTRHCKGTGQDGEFGRDATDGKKSDGRAGFSFVKVSATGQDLPRDATEWACVRDTVTGLMWEGKTTDGGLHDVNGRYTNVGDSRAGDASVFLAAVNAAGWCGATDWRLPTRRESESLVDFSVPEGGPMIDTGWFPASAATLHWTSTSAQVNGGGPDYRWAVNYYGGGSIWYGGEYGEFAVRLVRQGQPVNDKRWSFQGAEVLDKSTGLIWRRCTEGQNWTGATCTGSPTVFLTNRDALAHARAVAKSTGMPWRTPNVKEASSLVDTRVRFPAISRTAFPGFPVDSYHTATSWTENAVYDWRANFAAGEVNRDFWGGSLLLVRDAP